jgi:Uma2 family endonuclease
MSRRRRREDAAMAVTTEQLTYEQYLAEGEVKGRYDIIDGVRIFMTNPTIGHQKVQGNVYIGIRAWRQTTMTGEVILAPCDVLIQRRPLRTRQPDVLFITKERLGDRDLDDPAPLDPAPELVVEILSPSDTGHVLEEKLADYISVGVQECWMVNRRLCTVEVLRLTSTGAESVATYNMGETVSSIMFPTLTLAVADAFAP